MNKAFYFLIALTLMFIAPMDIHSQLKMDSVAVTDISCYGDDDGEITVFASGGKKPYKFGLNRGFAEVQTIKTSNFIEDRFFIFKNLSPNDKYWVFVEDSDGNASAKRLESDIIEPKKLSAAVSHKPSPSGQDHYDISINPEGGIPPYQLMDEEDNIVKDDFEQNIIIEKALKAGSHKLYLFDSNNCKFIIEFEIN